MAEVLAERFRVLEPLGHGGMSRVVIARDMNTGRDVALKIIHPHLARQELIRERIAREVAFTRAVRHPGIIEVYDFYQDSGRDLLFLAMEYVAGGSLKDLISRTGVLAVSEILRIGRETLAALGAAHDQGIIHRDIKPHNILFDSEGNAKLTDFGLAGSSSLQGLSTDTHIAGTPEYCAPEIIRGEFVDARADLYSMGITLYEAATGKLPFRSNLPYRTLQLQLEASPEPLRHHNPGIPEGLEAVILRAVEKDPGDRFQTAADFAEALAGMQVDTRVLVRGFHVCSGCGAEIPDALPYCFNCRQEPLLVSSSRTERCRVVVTGPGKSGDKLSQDHRDICLNVLHRAGARSPRLAKRMPRVPFVLLKGIDRRGAEAVSAALIREGLDAMVDGPGLLESERAVRKLLNRKMLALVPRVWLVALCSMGGIWTNLGRMPGVLLPVVAGTFLVAIPVVGWIAFRSAAGTLEAKRRYRSLTELLAASRHLRSRHLQSLAQRIAARVQVLMKGITRSDVPDEVRKEVTAVTDKVIEQVAARMRMLQDIDTLLKEDRELALYREIEEAGGKFQDAATVEDAGTELYKKGSLQDVVEKRRGLEKNAAILVDGLLRFSSRLDRLCLSLSAVQAAGIRSLAEDLQESARELDTQLDAYRELERFLQDGAPGGQG